MLRNFQCTKLVFSSFLPYEWLNILFFFFKLLNHTHLLLSLNLICLYSCGAFELYCFPQRPCQSPLFKTKSKNKQTKQTHLVPVTIELSFRVSSPQVPVKKEMAPFICNFTSRVLLLPPGDDCICSMGSGGAAMFWKLISEQCYKTQSHWFLMHGLDSHFLFFNFWCFHIRFPIRK